MLEFRKCSPVEYYGEGWDELFVVSKKDMQLGILYFVKGIGWWFSQRKHSVSVDDLQKIIDFTGK